MKENIKRVLAATGLVIAVLLVAVSAFPGSTALAQGGNGNGSTNGNNSGSGNGNGNSKAPYVKCVNGQLVLYEWTMNQNGTSSGGSSTGSSNNNQGKWMQTVIGTCASDTEAILNQLAKQYGMSRAQLDALVAIEFRNGAIPQGFDLQTWFANYMANQNGTNNSSNNSSNNNSSNNNSSNSTTGTNQGSTTSTNQSGSNGTSTGTNSGTNSNGGVGGAGAPAVIPTTGGGLDTVSPLVLAFGAILMALGLGVYKVSATR